MEFWWLYILQAREARKKVLQEMSEETKAAFEKMRFYKFYPVQTQDSPDISDVKVRLHICTVGFGWSSLLRKSDEIYRQIFNTVNRFLGTPYLVFKLKMLIHA